MDILRDAVSSIMADFAEGDAIGYVIHALRRDMTRHQVVNMLPDAATIIAERISHHDGLPELPPLPTCMGSCLDASSRLVVTDHIKVLRIVDRVTERVVHSPPLLR